MEPIKTEVVVIGAGPGGYAAAFRAADLGKQVVLVEKYDVLGGVCLNVGCIPSKALLHAARVKEEVAEMQGCGLTFGDATIDREKLSAWRMSVIKRLTQGLQFLAKKRKVTILQGDAVFQSANQLQAGEAVVEFEQAIIATGSRPKLLPSLLDDPRIVTSTGALKLEQLGKRMLIIGGGIIGLEMATIYEGLGSEVTLVEVAERLVPDVDSDVAAPLQKRLQKKMKQLYLKTQVKSVEAKADAVYVTLEGEKAPADSQPFDLVLCAVGREPNSDGLGLEALGIFVDKKGFIPVNEKQQTAVDNVYAIGDVVGHPMLAHKASYEGRLAAEMIAGMSFKGRAKVIPNVAYTDPEIASVGLSEEQAKAQGIDCGSAIFPWMASGRAWSVNRTEGITKIIVDKANQKLIGAAIVGLNAGELIGEMALAIENGLTVDQLAQTIHPHPTLCETMMMAAEVFEGTVTDL